MQRQLAGVMGQLQAKRKRSEDALAQARKLREDLERMEPTTVPRPDGVRDGVPVYQMDRAPLERLIQTGEGGAMRGLCHR